MSMYKTIFVTEAENQAAAGEKIFSVNGEVKLTGDSAFASLNEAVAAVTDGKAIAVVHKVASGKYESFVVEGTEFTAVSAIAVDFNGGTVMIDGKEVTVADSGIDAEAQATVLADLNAKNAANGRVFVAANDVTAGLPTIYVGQGADGYVAGTNAAVVTGSDADTMIGILDSQVNTSTSGLFSPTTLYVNSDYTTDGKTKFKTYAEAVAFVSKKSSLYSYNIVIQNVASADKYDGNYALTGTEEAILGDGDIFRTNTTVNDGARLDISTNKADINYDITVKGGGTLAGYRDNGGGVTEMHIKSGGSIVAGEANGKRATVNLMVSPTRGYDVLTTWGDVIPGSIEMVNTDFTCRDLSLKDGAGTFKNSTLVIQGALSASAKLTLEGSTATVWGNNGHSSEYFKDFNDLANVKLTNSTLNIGVENDNITPDKVVLGSVEMSNSFINVEKTAQVFVNGSVTLTGTSALNVGALDIASGKTLKIDSTATITADSLNAAGNIVINLVNGFTGGKIIDINGSGLTQEAWNKLIADNKITITGTGKDDFGLTIQEGDIYVMKGIGIKNNTLDLTENKAETFAGNIGNANDDLTINASGDAASGSADIKADVKAKDVILNNSKDLAVTGSVDAAGNMTITNAADGKLTGKNDGVELSAAGKLTFVNDGHAEIDMNAKEIDIKNNSANTIANSSIGYDAEGKVSAETVSITAKENADGKVINSDIGAKNSITIADQTVTGTDFATPTLNVYGETELGTGNTYSTQSNIFLGSKENSVNATLDVTDTSFANMVIGNGTVTLTGKMDETLSQGPQLDVGAFHKPGGVAPNDPEMGSTTVNIAEGAYVKAHQVYIAENEAVNKHTLNVYGQLDATAAVFTKAKGELNVYGEMNVADGKYLQAAGDVTVSGANAELNVGGTSNYGIKIGTDENGLRSEFTIANGASVNVGTLVEVGYSSTRNGDLIIDGGNFSANSVSIQNGSTFTVSGNSTLNIGKLSGSNIEVVGTADLTGSNVGGNISAGFSKNTAADLSINGDFKAGVLYVGNKWENYTDGTTHTLNVNTGKDKTMEVGTLNIRSTTTATIDNSNVKMGDLLVRGALTVSGSSLSNGGEGGTGHWVVYEDDAADKTASIKVSNSTIKNYNYIAVGKNSNSTANADSNAYAEFVNSTISVGSLYLQGAENFANNYIKLDGGTSLTASKGVFVGNYAELQVNNSTLTAASITNNGTVTVAGESTLNIDQLTGSSIDLLDGAIIKNSTVGGAAYVAGNVTFRGDNTFTMITDYGDYYNSTTPSTWTVEEGASLTLTKYDRYGLGYGDVVSVYGKLENVRGMDAETRDEQFVSLNMHGGLVQMTNSAAPNAENKLTIENARVRFGFEGDKSFGNASGNYYGNDTITVKNSIFETNGFKYHEAKGKTALTFTDSVVTANGIFMTNDADSTFTFDNTSVFSKAISNGSDDKNQNAGTMILKNNSEITYSAKFTNIGSVTISDSTFTATEIVNNGTITLTVTDAFLSGLKDDVVLINQTNANAAALNAGVKFGDEVYQIGDYVTTIGKNDYYLTKGDGNDIVLDVRKDTIYVNSDGSGDFTNFADARAYAAANAPTATIVVQETNGINVVEGGIRNLPDMNIVIEDGAALGTGYNSMKLTQDVTIEAGGFFGNLRNDTYGNLQIEGSNMVVGEAEATEKAELDLYKGNKYSSGHTGGQSLVVKENSSFTANNAEIEFSDFTANGAASFTNTNATVQGTVALGWDRTDSKGNFFEAANATMTNTTMNVVGNGALKGDGYGQPVNSFDKLTMTNSSIIVDDQKEGSAAADVTIGNVAMTGSTFTAEAGTDVTVTGNVNITDSSLTVGSLAMGENGKLNLTLSHEKLLATGTTAYYLINQTETSAAALDVKVNYNGKEYAVGDTLYSANGVDYKLVAGDNNDIAIQATAEKFVVDAAFTTATAGYGISKFNSFTAALKAASESQTVKEIKIASSINGEVMPSDVEFIVNNDIVITSDTPVSVNLKNVGTTYDIVLNSTNGNTITFGKNVSIALDDRVIWAGYYGNNVEIEINGSVSGYQWWNGADTTVNAGGKLSTSGEAMIFRRGATLTVNGNAAQGAAAADREVQIDANYMNFLSGNLIATNSRIESGAVWIANNGSYTNESSVWINLDNTVLNSTGNLRLNSDDGSTALMIVENGSTLNVTNHDGYEASSINRNGHLWVYDSTASLKDLNNAGDIDIADSNFVVNGTLTNAGTFTADDSTVNADLINNSGSFNVTGNSTFNVDKVEGSTALKFGNVDERSTITLGSKSGNGAALTANIYNADVTLTDNVSVTTIGTLSRIQNSTIDMGGKTLSYSGFTLLDSTGANQGVTLKNGTFKVDTNNLFIQNYDHVISSDAVMDVAMNGGNGFNVDGSATVYGKINVVNSDVYGYGNVGRSKESMLTVSGKDAEFTYENGHMFRVGLGSYKDTLNVVDGAEFSFTGTRSDLGIFYNGGIVNVDADSSFTVSNFYNNLNGVKGSFNSETAGEMVILGDVNVTYKLVTDTLVLNQGAVLSAGSITVDNLTLSIGSTLSIGGASKVESITVVGDLVPQNGEFTLITSGWDTISTATGAKPSITYKGNTYEVVGYSDSLSGLQFVTVGNNLYVKDFGAAVEGIYIGDITVNTPGFVDVNNNGTVDAGDKFTDSSNATYEIGKDAFTSMEAAMNSSTLNKDNVTEVTLGTDDLVSDVSRNFANVSNIKVEKGAEINDNVAASFGKDLNIDNDGTLNAKVIVNGDLTFTNTSKDTLTGSYTAYSITGTNTGAMAGAYTADDKIVINNTDGLIGGAKGEANFQGSQIEIKGGDASRVNVNAGSLTLTDTNSFGLNADSAVLNGEDNIWIPENEGGIVILKGDANISIDGTNNAIGAQIESVNHTGTVTFNGTQTYTGDIAANKFVVAETSNVTVNSNQFDFNELNIAGTLNTDFTKQDSFTQAGSITGAGNFNTTHTGAWIINDTVERDFSGFNGTVTMENTNASIVMGKGDAVAGSTVSSYFADGSTVKVNGAQSVVLAQTGVNTAINFAGNGNINVGNYDGAFAEKSTGFTQTLSGTNSGFTGTVNVSEGAALTLESAIGAATIDLDAPSTSTAAEDATKLILDAADVVQNAAIFGDANDIIDVNANQTLNKISALDNFSGTVDLNVNEITLNEVNNTAAKFTGTADSIIDTNADLTLSAAAALNGFNGTVELEGNDLTLGGANETAAKFTGTADSIINANAAQTLNAAGAINGFAGTVALGTNELTLNGANETAAKFSGTGIIDANADQILNGAGALNDFSGIVELDKFDLTLNDVNNTAAKFTGTADSIINANANQILNGTGALNQFNGDVNIADNTSVTLNGVNTTSAEFVGGATAALNVNANQFLNVDNTNFDGKLNIDSKAEVQFNGDFGTVNGNSTINFNANDSSIYVAPGYAVDINSKLVSNTVSGEIFYIGGEATLTADGALNNFDGTLRLSNKNADTKLILKGDNTTNATLYSANSNILHSVVLDGGDLTLTNNDALKDYYGAIKVNNNKITLDVENGSFSATSATFHGNSKAVMNVNDSITMLGNPNPLDKKTGKDAISGFAGTIKVADNATLTIDSANTTAAKFVSENGTLVFAANYMPAANTLTSDGALDNMKGNIKLSSGGGLNSGASLVLNGINTTEADVRGDLKSVITANANQYFTGNVSSFSGTYDIATGANVTLSGTIADTITAKGGTLTLSGAAANNAVVTVKSTADGDLANLNIGANNVKLTGGDTNDFTNVTGSGNIVDFGVDQTFGTVTAGTIFVTGSQDALTIGKLNADINISIDALQTDDKADVTVSGAFAGDISVNLAANAFAASTSAYNSYKLVTNKAFDTNSSIMLSVGTSAEQLLKVDDRVIIDGKAYLLQLKENTLILTEMPGYSNYVAIDGAWSGKRPYQAVNDEGTERIIGYDAASKLDDAVGYIRGYNTGINANAGTNTGDATMELVNGAYELTTGTLMTSDNGVTQLVLKGRAGDSVVITGTLRGSDGSAAADGTPTELIMENVRTNGFVFAGGNLTINNSASLRSSGNAIAAGIANQTSGTTLTMANSSTLTINGGYFSTSVLTGGSVAFGGNVEVNGATSVVIDNTSAETLTITGNIFGGSYAAQGNVTQNGDAYVFINADNATTLRGNIYVSGYNSSKGVLTMNGNSYITFSGDASKLAFTGSVKATQSAKAEIATFDDFKGQFNGSLIGFDSITISGDTNLSLGRRQTETANTGLVFKVTADTDTSDGAMYTVRDANAWEFSKSITIDASAAKTGSYVLVDNYKAGFEGFTFTLNGQAYTLGSVAGSSVIKAVDDQLILSVYDSNMNLVGDSTEQVVIDSTSAGETMLVGNITSSDTVALDVTKEGAVVTNAGSVSGIAESGSAAVAINAAGVELVNNGEVTGGDTEVKTAAVVIAKDSHNASITNTGTITGGNGSNSNAILVGLRDSDKAVVGAEIINSGNIVSNDTTGYNRAILAVSKDLSVNNAGTINGGIYQSVYNGTSLNIENTGTITTITTGNGDAVVSTSNGLITLSGNGGTYELLANTEANKFSGKIVEGQNGIMVSANNATFKAGYDIVAGNGNLNGLYNDYGQNIEIAGDNNTIALSSKKSVVAINEYSNNAYKGAYSDVIISGDNNVITANSAGSSEAIIARSGSIVITGKGTEINVSSTGSYANGLKAEDRSNAAGNITIGKFNADGSVAEASDIQLSVNGKVNGYTPTAIIAQKGTAQIALAADGKIESSHIAISAEQVKLTNAGVITGDVIASGSATDDMIAMDINSVINGKVSGVENLNITGISELATDTNGVKAIANIDAALSNATIEGQNADAEGFFQLAGADNAIGTADDVWAAISKEADKDAVVAWGTSKEMVSSALTELSTENLAIGDTYAIGTATDNLIDDTNKKNGSNGTLA